MEVAFFEGGGSISTKKGCFYGRGVFLARGLIFHGRGRLKNNRLITYMKNRNHCTAKMSFCIETAFFKNILIKINIF